MFTKNELLDLFNLLGEAEKKAARVENRIPMTDIVTKAIAAGKLETILNLKVKVRQQVVNQMLREKEETSSLPVQVQEDTKSPTKKG